MSIDERESCFLIKEFFGSGIIAGFSRPEQSGEFFYFLKEVFEPLGINPGLSHMKQTHSARVIWADKPGSYKSDGLFSKSAGLVLAVKTADCLPLLLADSSGSAIGVIHMGWRSAAGGIIGSIPVSLDGFSVAAGPGLRKCCYEVGEEFFRLPGLAKHTERRRGKIFFDPVSFSRDELVKSGLKMEEYFDTGICTLCDQRNFFSYRRDKTSKRIFSFIFREF